MVESDFVRNMKLIQSRIKGMDGVMSCDGNDIKLALIEIKQIGKEEGRKEAITELEKIYGFVDRMSKKQMENYVYNRLKLLQGVKQ